MINLKKIFYTLLLPAVMTLPLGLAITSCHSETASELNIEGDDEDEMSVDGSDMVITFNTNCPITFDSSDLSSGLDYDDGMAMENYIDGNKVRIYFTANVTSGYGGALYASSYDVTPYAVRKLDDNCYKAYCHITNDMLTKYKAMGAFCAMVAVNWPSNLPDNGVATQYSSSNKRSPRANVWMAMADTDAAYTYSYGGDSYFIPSESTPIPMWGFNNYSSFTAIKNGNVYDLGTVYLHRAMAKIVVKATDDTEISEVLMAKCKDRGACGPVACYSNSVTELTNENINRAGELSPNTQFISDNNIANVPFRKVVDDEGNVEFVAYVPEWRINTGTTGFKYAGESNYLIVKCLLYDDYSKSFKLQFRYEGTDDDGTQYGDNASSTNTSYFDIIRNHKYVFNINLIRKESEPGLHYAVKAYQSFTAGDIVFE